MQNPFDAFLQFTSQDFQNGIAYLIWKTMGVSKHFWKW